MIKIISSSSLLIAFLFINSFNPPILLLLILIQSLLVCWILWLSLNLSFFSYILFLTFVGGMLIVFSYICSLASNEVISVKLSKNNLMIIFLLMIFIFFENKINLFNHSYLNFLNKMNQKNFFLIFILSAIFLFIILIVIVKISMKKMGAMRMYKK